MGKCRNKKYLRIIKNSKSFIDKHETEDGFKAHIYTAANKTLRKPICSKHKNISLTLSNTSLNKRISFDRLSTTPSNGLNFVIWEDL